ncbi:membrane protein [Microbacterium phage Pepe25]|nr:membrane protein [Microbacterium phage Pepe25]
MIDVTWDTLPLILLTLVTAVLGVARLTRVMVYDDFPPSKWWREKWVEWTDGTGWQMLFICWWCLSFWIALVCVGWWIGALFVPGLGWAWWIFWGALAIGYVAPMIIVRDEPAER